MTRRPQIPAAASVPAAAVPGRPAPAAGRGSSPAQPNRLKAAALASPIAPGVTAGRQQRVRRIAEPAVAPGFQETSAETFRKRYSAGRAAKGKAARNRRGKRPGKPVTGYVILPPAKDGAP